MRTLVAVLGLWPHSLLMTCRNADKRRLGDVAVLDLDSFTWRRPAVSGTAPSPREGAAAAYHAGHMVLFGEASSLSPPGPCAWMGCLPAGSFPTAHTTSAATAVGVLPYLQTLSSWQRS